MVLNATFNLNEETIGGLCPEKQLYTSKVVLQVYAPDMHAEYDTILSKK